MVEKSRTEYSARNTTVAMISRIVAILLGYVARIVFTHVLSQEYVGINGLFRDILNVLALSELGVGSAITYALYKPIADGDTEKQKSLLKLFKSLYIWIAMIILLLGLLVIPFMDVLIKDKPDVPHLTFIYILYLANSVLSYLCIYKKTIVDAHQLNYISVVYQTSFWTLQNIVQIILLIVTKNFILYTSVNIVCTLGNNFFISKKADELFPYIKEKNVTPISKEEKQSLINNIKAMLMHKVGNVLVNNTDNLLLSALVGTLAVGSYSNYYLVIGSIRQVLEQTFQGVAASVGNLGVKEGKDRIEKIFDSTFFLGQWIYGVATICIYEAIDIFVGVSFGEQYVFAGYVTLILSINFYINGMRQATLIFRDAMGIFKYDKYKAIPEAMINLVVSIWLGKQFGVVGIFLGTLVSMAATSLWIEPFMLYKHKIEKSALPYFGKYLMYAVVTGLLWLSEDEICAHINGYPLMVCILRVIVCFIMTNVAYFIIYNRTKEFRLLMEKGVGLINKKLGKT